MVAAEVQKRIVEAKLMTLVDKAAILKIKDGQRIGYVLLCMMLPIPLMFGALYLNWNLIRFSTIYPAKHSKISRYENQSIKKN